MLEKRIVTVFCAVMLCFMATGMRLYSLASEQGELREAAVKQSTYVLSVASARGTIYDRNLVPLTNSRKKKVAAVLPDTKQANALAGILPSEEMQQVYEKLSLGKPFLLTLPDSAESAELDLFTVSAARYREEPFCAHVIGYIDGDGKGISGAERAFDGLLSDSSGEILLTCTVDAVGHAICTEDREIRNTYANSAAGVALTIDEKIQSIAESAARQYLDTGAVIVTEVSTGKILALVSLPDFSQNEVGDALSREDAPLLNRAAQAYAPGSVFKLVSLAAALESGAKTDFSYTCTGACEVAGQTFRCYHSLAHGTLDMRAATAKSCNCYFISLMQTVPEELFLETAQRLGFGSSVSLMPGWESAPGTLPSAEDLTNLRALANFSFGQGALTVTPLQIASLIGTIANSGKCSPLSLIEGYVGKDGCFSEKTVPVSPTYAISAKTAALIRNYMREAVENGTARSGKPEHVTAGAKTGTAETGVYEGDTELSNLWYAGFFPYASPKYTVTVLADFSAKASSPCGAVFSAIADALYS